jgi:hypothetical protein
MESAIYTQNLSCQIHDSLLNRYKMCVAEYNKTNAKLVKSVLIIEMRTIKKQFVDFSYDIEELNQLDPEGVII